MLPLLANMGAWVWWPARLHGPHIEIPTLTIERELLELACARPEGARLACTFVAHYTVHNPQSQEARVTATLFARYARTSEILVDGVPRGRPLEETEWQRLVQSTQQVMPGWPWPGNKKCKECPIPLDRQGFDLQLPGGSTSEVEVRGILDETDQPNELIYELAPIRSWGKVREIQLVVRVPAGQQVRVGTFETFDPTGRPALAPVTCTSDGPVTRCDLVGVPSWLHVDLPQQ
jgi:hypothetical protein